MRKGPKLSRRTLAALLGLPALPATSQTPPSTDPRQTLRRDADELAKVKIPRDCAPAFRFEP